MEGRTTDALPLFDRALAVTQADPALTDLRLLLQLNNALALGDLDQYEDAFAAARQAQQLAARAGIIVRLALAQCCLLAASAYFSALSAISSPNHWACSWASV